MKLTERDMNVFYALNKLRILDIDTIAQLCGFPKYNKCADRMAILYKNGYVDFNQQGMNTKKHYFIKQKGMNVLIPGEERISKTGVKYIHYQEPPKFRQNNVNHEVTTAKVLVYLLRCNPELTIKDFKTDREMQSFIPMKRKTFRHCCDLFCEKYRIKVEVELSNKDKTRLRNNLSLNGNGYVQVWIAGNTPVYNRLVAERKRYPQFDIHIIKLEELEEHPINFNELYEELLKINPTLLEKLQRKERRKLKKQQQISIDDL